MCTQDITTKLPGSEFDVLESGVDVLFHLLLEEFLVADTWTQALQE